MLLKVKHLTKKNNGQTVLGREVAEADGCFYGRIQINIHSVTKAIGATIVLNR